MTKQKSCEHLLRTAGAVCCFLEVGGQYETGDIFGVSYLSMCHMDPISTCGV